MSPEEFLNTTRGDIGAYLHEFIQSNYSRDPSQQHPTSYIHDFFAYLFSTEISGSELILMFKRILSARQTWEEYAEDAKNMPESSTRCGVKWHGGHTAYRCNTCQITTSSCMCIPCFNDSDHVGHEYYIYSSSLGGVCDCGANEAWKSSGFCTKHRGDPPENTDPTDTLSLVPVILVKEISDACFAHIENSISAYCEHATSPDSRFPDIVLFLEELSALHCGFRRIISQRMQKFLDSRDSLEKVFTLPLDLVHMLSKLILELIFDMKFKKAFARVFTLYYTEYVKKILRVPEVSKTVDKLTVNIFTAKDICIELITGNGLFMRLLNGILLLFHGVSRQVKFTPVAYSGNSVEERVVYRADPEHSVLRNLSMWQVSHDLKFVLSHKECHALFIAETQNLECFYECAAHINRMNVLKRIPEEGEHVEMETEAWQISFQTEKQFYALHETIIQKLVDRNDISAFTECFDVCLRACVGVLGDYADEGVSFHHPMHRLLMTYLLLGKDALQLDVTDFFRIRLNNFLSESSDVSGDFERITRYFLADAMAALGFCAQSHAKLWVRNGIEVIGSMYYYTSTFGRSMSHDLDIQCVQLIGSLRAMPSYTFLSTLRCAVFNGVPANDNLSYEFFKLLIGFCSEMFPLWVDVSKFRRNELLHRLFLSDATFSKCEAFLSVSTEQTENSHAAKMLLEEFEAILNEISDFIRPQNMLEGKYRIKTRDDCLWSEFSPYFSHYTPEQRNSVFDRFQGHLSVHKCNVQPRFNTGNIGMFFPTSEPLCDVISECVSAISAEVHVNINVIQSLCDFVLILVRKSVFEENSMNFIWFLLFRGQNSVVSSLVTLLLKGKHKLVEKSIILLVKEIVLRLEEKNCANLLTEANIPNPDVLAFILSMSSQRKNENVKETHTRMQEIAERKRKIRERQKKLIEKYQSECKNFTDKNAELSTADSDQTATEVCCICGIESEGMGLIGLFQQTSPVTVCGSPIMFRTCHHSVHFQCFLSYNSSSDDSYELLENECQCPVCRRISNCFVPNIPRALTAEPGSIPGTVNIDTVIEILRMQCALTRSLNFWGVNNTVVDKAYVEIQNVMRAIAATTDEYEMSRLFVDCLNVNISAIEMSLRTCDVAGYSLKKWGVSVLYGNLVDIVQKQLLFTKTTSRPPMLPFVATMNKRHFLPVIKGLCIPSECVEDCELLWKVDAFEQLLYVCVWESIHPAELLPLQRSDVSDIANWTSFIDLVVMFHTVRFVMEACLRRYERIHSPTGEPLLQGSLKTTLQLFFRGVDEIEINELLTDYLTVFYRKCAIFFKECYAIPIELSDSVTGLQHTLKTKFFKPDTVLTNVQSQLVYDWCALLLKV